MIGRLSLKQRRELRAKGLYKNESESEAVRIFDRLGLFSVRRGYPDFTIIKDDEIAGFIEVKPNFDKELKKDQKRFARFCEKHQIPFMKWTPADGEIAISAFARSL